MNNGFIPEIALIMRDDSIIEKFNLKRVTIPTSYGPVHRCYYGYIYDVPVLIIYGRFNGEKSPSFAINHQQTIEAIKNSGAKKVIGTFVVGGIKKEYDQGTVFIPNDMIGMGNYKIDWDYNKTFHNAEMITPVCKSLYEKLVVAGERASEEAKLEEEEKYQFNVVKNATYVCFNGYPRIETRAELRFYEMIGADCVGQTMDPEATICRLNGLCYAGVAVQIDSPASRTEHVDNLKNDVNSNPYNKSIKECRKNTSRIVLNFLKNYKKDECTICGNVNRKNNSFMQFPASFYE